MKTELTDVSDTQKTLSVEIPSEIVDAEIARVAKSYSKQAKIPGFRPGKVPATVVKQRFRDQILHDVIHDLIPRAVEEALQERGIEPVATPDVRDVSVKEGQPLTFTAAIETVPPFDPGDLSELTVHAHPVTITAERIEETLQQLRERAATFEVVEGRPVADGDAIGADLARTDAAGETESHENITIEIGSPGNPPDFDVNLIGLNPGDDKRFTVRFPETYSVAELAGTELTYEVKVREIRQKVMPALDDAFAKGLGDFDSLDALRTRVRDDLQRDGEAHAKQHTRTDLLTKLSQRVTFELPPSMVEREMDRRSEEFVRQLMSQNMDPRTSGIDWAQFRESQRAAARDSVASALVLDEIARREQITVAGEDVDKEIEQFALRAGRTPAALRAQLEKEGGISRLYTGLRREKAVDLALSRAKMLDEAHHPQSIGEE